MKKTMDGNMAAAHIAYAFSEISAIYPITPSSPMAEYTDEWSSQGKKNIWGQPVKITEMQSEAGAAGAVHGALKAGALATTYTASQGLLLMIPSLFKIAGELLPSVIHVAARAVTTNALNIFGDQSDIMTARTTGYAMLAEASVQEVMDLSAVAHLATIEASVPFLNFFDGFRTSHELQKIDVINYEDLAEMINQEKLEEFRNRAMNPDHPSVSGSNQNPDIHFQQRETVNSYYEATPAIVQKYMRKINELRGTNYDLVNYYGDPEATEVIVSLGSVGQTVEQVVDYLNANGRKVGFINIHLYRPFPVENFIEHLPKTAKNIAVLDRTKEPGSNGEPLYLDVKSALFDHDVKVIGGRYGIGSKDTTPQQIIAVYDELLKEKSKTLFTVGIKDDVTNLSLDLGEEIDLTPSTTYQAKFWGFGSDGTVGANKSAIKIIGNNTDKYIQGAFSYDSKKSGGLTVSHLRFGSTPIKSTYLIQSADFVAVHASNYLHQYDVLKGLKPGGTFLLNTLWNDEQLDKHLPSKFKKYIAENNIEFYTLDAVNIAREVGLGRRINTAMQVAFFKLTNIMPFDQAMSILKQDALDSYARKSMKIVESNHLAMDLAAERLHKVEVPKSWKDAQAPEKKKGNKGENKYVFQIVNSVNSQEGDELSVGDLVANNMTDGRIPVGTAAFEKRGVALEVPVWNAEACTACNQCSFVCPHAAIRPFLIDEDEMNQAPDGYHVKDFKGKDGLMYRIQVSVEDCTGCGLCVEACPAKEKGALVMKPYEEVNDQTVNWAFSMTLKQKENPARENTVLGSQFNKPLLEFSGACSGCGETPYVKLLTQMFGDRMMIANATGCSSIWGGAAPATPYTTNEDGQGPAWSNSLLEDNAEFGYGMWLASVARRDKLASQMEDLIPFASEELANLMKDWIEHRFESQGTRQRAEKLKAALKDVSDNDAFKEIIKHQDQFVKPSQWMIGGDGWAYDIGYGGIDHVIASGADVNLLVMDNEVYANTGGQVSKATPASAIEKFSAAGKEAAKKDLGFMAMTYGNVYVAQIASGANQMQTIKAFEEAERHNGPSLIIAYTPCISHGLRGGMSKTLTEAKEAVDSGYWQLYRYNPDLEEKGKNPLTLDFKKPNFDQMTDFMLQQVRFSSLKSLNPSKAELLFEKTKQDARRKFLRYARMSGDAEKFLAKEEKAKGIVKEETEKVEKPVRREKRERVVDPEAEARRAARRAERAAKRATKDE
ncbi:pyruvate:ferredoxin (flavodoxin) oxidoreductase [Floricoccus penangensis]|uniref:pyruvate:ferredoxin (flavodoxin) oxidoreductase n=1 Tax=Floricoccus penangensis TaxID=1859475 RepID=UPI00203C3843|nr:pyruvate:ferredoxin (flavodoxin) oxidoreductase [Floricoccus penangensis]